jgi:serine/threonine-protein kinase HipA
LVFRTIKALGLNLSVGKAERPGGVATVIDLEALVQMTREVGTAPQGIQWITREELEERMGALLKDHAAARRDGDRGQFSLAGAQPKMGLYRDDQTGRWGVPEGETPTTHILKPKEGRFADHDQNEHYCLTLARHLGMP